MRMRKALPQLQEGLHLPNHAYRYFAQGQSHPFRPQVTTFEPVNAWWLAEAALLAYAEEPFIRQVWRQDDLQPENSKVAFFRGRSTQCFVVQHADFVLVAFRGTEIRPQEGLSVDNIIADIRINLRFRLVEAAAGGRVHQGFQDALDEVWEPSAPQDGLRAHLDQAQQRETSPRPLWFTGHSLGGALAILAAARYGQAQGVYTFGAPRIGDLDFRNQFSVPAYQVINQRDPVPCLPPGRVYQNVGHLVYIDRGGTLHTRPSQWTRWLKCLPLRFQLLDHAPLFYAIHCWNHYADATV